ncbi:MAG: NAD-dependent epimerase/dehydratase family protein [Promethearchaeota archaeon]
MSKILVTGGTGFLGSWILRALDTPPYCDDSEYDTIRLLVRNPDKAKDLKSDHFIYEIVRGDLTDHASLKRAATGVDAVIHVASLLDNKSPWSEFQKVNLDSTEALIQSLEADTKFILTASTAVYGFPNIKKKIHEDYEPRNLFGFYQKAKKLQEDQARQLCQEKNLPFISIRPPTILGSRDHSTFPKLIKTILRRKFIFIRGGKIIIPIAHAWDVAIAHLQGLKYIDQYNGEAFHIASFHATIKECIDILCQELGVKPIKWNVPYPLAYSIGLLADLLPVKMDYSRYAVKFFASNMMLDLTNITTKLKFQANYDLNLTIKEIMSEYNLKKRTMMGSK